MFYALVLTAQMLPTVAWGFTSTPGSSLLPLRSGTTIFSSGEPSLGSFDKPVSDESSLSSDNFLTKYFISECDNLNSPPSLGLILKSFDNLGSGSDVRGQFVDHPRLGNPRVVASAIDMSTSSLSALTPFAAHCLGFAFASMLKESLPESADAVVCVGRDPRPHGVRLADAFCRGVEEVENARVVYTGIATTPSLSAFCRSSLCDGGVIVTASHLPADRNGFKFFTVEGGFTGDQVRGLIGRAKVVAQRWYDAGLMPPSSGYDAVFCSEWVDWMPLYERQLKKAVMLEVYGENAKATSMSPLRGLKIVLNSGHGSGGFFEGVLEDLGADVTASIHNNPDASFPAGVPNPENIEMIEETVEACRTSIADIGILLDTDADRCGLVIKSKTGYEPLNRNRLIAMMGVIMARQSPGCAIVTDSVTSIGLSSFLQHLGLVHSRYIRGYANVIRKARSLTESGSLNAEVAIETSGHCALKENGYLDDGTYTAIKVLGLLAREKLLNPDTSLFGLISDLQELQIVREDRLPIKGGSMESLERVFNIVVARIEESCNDGNMWSVDEENLEGIRVTTGDDDGFFMIRKSLHDPVLSFHVEASSIEHANLQVLEPLLSIFRREDGIHSILDFSNLAK